MGNVLRYDNLDGFYEGIAQLTRHGITFKANPNELYIILTGGY